MLVFNAKGNPALYGLFAPKEQAPEHKRSHINKQIITQIVHITVKIKLFNKKSPDFKKHELEIEKIYDQHFEYAKPNNYDLHGVLKDGKTVMGAASGTTHEIQLPNKQYPTKNLHVAYFAKGKQWREKGLVRKLLEQFIAVHGQDHKAETVTLSCENTPKLVEYYKSHGFETIGPTTK